MKPCAAWNTSAAFTGAQGAATGPRGVAHVPTQLLGTSSPHPRSCSPVQSARGGIYPRAPRCFSFQMRKISSSGRDLCESLVYGEQAALRGPHSQNTGAGHCCGALLPGHCISCKPRAHWQSRACFSPFEGCVSWRRLLASFYCIGLFRKTQISLH